MNVENFDLLIEIHKKYSLQTRIIDNEREIK